MEARFDLTHSLPISLIGNCAKENAFSGPLDRIKETFSRIVGALQNALIVIKSHYSKLNAVHPIPQNQLCSTDSDNESSTSTTIDSPHHKYRQLASEEVLKDDPMDLSQLGRDSRRGSVTHNEELSLRAKTVESSNDDENAQFGKEVIQSMHATLKQAGVADLDIDKVRRMAPLFSQTIRQLVLYDYMNCTGCFVVPDHDQNTLYKTTAEQGSSLVQIEHEYNCSIEGSPIRLKVHIDTTYDFSPEENHQFKYRFSPIDQEN